MHSSNETPIIIHKSTPMSNKKTYYVSKPMGSSGNSLQNINTNPSNQKVQKTKNSQTSKPKKRNIIEPYHKYMEECIFTPANNKHYKPKINTCYQSIYERPSNKISKNDKKMINNTDHFINSNTMENFHSNNNYNNLLNENLCKPKQKTKEKISPVKNNKFYSNQMNHMDRVKDKILYLKLQKLGYIDEQCTFSPKINNNYQIKNHLPDNNINITEQIQPNTSLSTNIPKYIKNKKDVQTSIENTNVIKLTISKEKDNPKSQRNIKQNEMDSGRDDNQRYNSQDSLLNSKSRFEKLYDDADEISNKKKKLEKEFYKDFTFKPSLIPVTNPNYQVKGDFLERNYKFIEKKNEKRKMNKQNENKKLEKIKAEIEKPNKNSDKILTFSELKEKKEKLETEKEGQTFGIQENNFENENVIINKNNFVDDNNENENKYENKNIFEKENEIENDNNKFEKEEENEDNKIVNKIEADNNVENNSKILDNTNDLFVNENPKIMSNFNKTMHNEEEIHYQSKSLREYQMKKNAETGENSQRIQLENNQTNEIK
jgi:hypothetical protein